MSLEQEINEHTNGTQFRRGDLHIHSFGEDGSYDVTDTTMTPEAIVDKAIAENLQVIAITDHNEIRNIRRALKHAYGREVLVVPGVELSTSQGHLLIYCPTYEALQSCFGKLGVATDRKTCSSTMAQCLKEANDVGGFGIAAHIDNESGLERSGSKYDQFKQDVLNAPNLLALEILSTESIDWFSHGDSNASRKNCMTQRCRHLGHEEDIELAKVMNSDAHTINAFGRNANGAKKLTRFKMESLTFESLKIALIDSEARVRLEDVLPTSVPHFVGMKLEGGFLAGQVINFSRNLTCIIGGRGAGKSTMLESLRAVSGNNVTSSVLDSEVWPDAISLVYQDEVGEHYVLRRTKLNETANTTDPVNGPGRILIESYGQGETAETIQHCGRDPGILLRFLDNFINLEGIPKRDRELQDLLLENQTEIEQLQMKVNQIPDLERAKAVADQQVEALKKQNAGELVELEQKLATETLFRNQLTVKLNETVATISECLSSEAFRDLHDELGTAKLAVGREHCDKVQALLSSLSDRIDTVSSTLRTEVLDYRTKFADRLREWTTKEHETKNKIEEIRRELEKQKVKLDLAFIRKVTKDATQYGQTLQDFKRLVPKKEAAHNKRRELLEERRKLKSRVFLLRQAFASMINRNLKATVIDYKVDVRFRESVFATELEEVIKTAMDWRTAQVPKATLIAKHVSQWEILEAIRKKDAKPIEQVKAPDGSRVFSPADAQNIIDTLSLWKNRTKIERCAYEDRPEILVTKTVLGSDGTKSFLSRDFSQLSLGQQQSILLSIMLFSKSRVPLIIDQPEDNLDSEFIYKTLVRSLRSVKEHRQVIIVTHNANIAVLGDAELIVPLRGASDRSIIRDRGSIDTEATKELVCTILEGSPKAFKRRRAVYGY